MEEEFTLNECPCEFGKLFFNFFYSENKIRYKYSYVECTTFTVLIIENYLSIKLNATKM